MTHSPSKAMKLFLLPGMDGTGKLFRPFVKALGDRVRPVVIDYPIDLKLSYADLIARVEARLPTDGEPFAVLAESFSGPLGLTLAQKRYPGMRGLILAVTFGATPRKMLIQLTRLLPMAWLLAQPIPCWAARRIMLGVDPPQDTVDALCGIMKEVSPEVIAARMEEVRDLELDPRRIDLPVMYLQATKDLLLPASAVDELRHWVSDLKVHQVEGPHLVLDTQPERCADLVADFVATLDGAA